MPIVTGDDVVAGIIALWQTDSTLTSAVSGIFHGRAEAEKEPPYAVVKVRPQKPELTSGAPYLQKWTVTVEIRGPATTNLPAGLMGTWGFLLQNTLPTINNATTTVGVWPGEGDYGLDPETKDALDQVLVSSTWDVMIQANRS